MMSGTSAHGPERSIPIGERGPGGSCKARYDFVPDARTGHDHRAEVYRPLVDFGTLLRPPGHEPLRPMPSILRGDERPGQSGEDV